ncbi:DUF6048 family protein [Marinigracilibium pacificum]|uniref:Outer membrane protein with beta-barrel domain n=1 Tax=Marinigracilibium pacificum TaxID=2729599 RepID=A0A848IUD1_9BACT|nr:DUF6048 family protein [Marinigracilibium pacificum]NMM46905.1 hypothetical protein [Marinigracilibium pacificum]
MIYLRHLLISGFLLIIISIVSFTNAVAQDAGNDTLSAVVTENEGKWKPVLYGLRIGADLYYPVAHAINNDLEQYEITADLDLGRYLLVVDYGIADYQIDHFSGSVMNINGSYFRVGGDVNFNVKDPREFVMFVGLRYAQAFYDSEFNYILEDDIFGTVNQSDVDNGVTSRWFELDAGIKVMVLKNIFLGFTGRLRFLNRVKNASTNEAYRIPGFGVNDGSSWGFNYYVYYRIPFRKSQSNN